MPMPDYAHRYALWRNLIVAAGGQILKWSDRFDLSSLTKVSDGYTAGHIKYAVEQTLTDRRVIQVGFLCVFEWGKKLVTPWKKNQIIKFMFFAAKDETFTGSGIHLPSGKMRTCP